MLKYVKELLEFAGPYKKDIQKAYLPTFIKTILGQMILLYSYFILLEICRGEYSPKHSLLIGMIILLTLVLQSLFQIIADRNQSAAGFKIMADKRKQLGEHLRKMPMGFFTEGNMGRISSILASDMVLVEQSGMPAISMTIMEFCNILVMNLFSFLIDWRLGLIVFLATVLVFFCGKAIMKITENESMLKLEQNQKLSEAVIEFSEGIGILKAYDILGEKSEDLNEVFYNSSKSCIDFEKKYTPWNLLIDILVVIATVVTLSLSFILYFKNILSLELFLGILLFLFEIFTPIRLYYSNAVRFGMIEAALRRVNELFQEVELEDMGKENFENESEYEIEFQKVSFSYQEKEVLHQISFQAKKNEMIALVGPSGGGKSTIASLIARLWDVNEGIVKIKGKNIKNVALSDLMQQISMVFQRVYLFQDSIYNNIAMGRPEASFEEVAEAARKARCYDFIMSLPDGFDTVLEEAGVNLSGGERQRISIARCILKDAPIIILDESTASVDADNEYYIQEAITELCKNKTIIVIAHRLNTIENANQILLISDGKIVESGQHKELMDQKGIYYRMVEDRKQIHSW